MKSCKVELMNALFHFKKATLALSWCSVGGRLTAVSQTMVTFNNPPVNAKVLRQHSVSAERRSAQQKI